MRFHPLHRGRARQVRYAEVTDCREELALITERLTPLAALGDDGMGAERTLWRAHRAQ